MENDNEKLGVTEESSALDTLEIVEELAEDEALSETEEAVAEDGQGEPAEAAAEAEEAADAEQAAADKAAEAEAPEAEADDEVLEQQDEKPADSDVDEGEDSENPENTEENAEDARADAKTDTEDSEDAEDKKDNPDAEGTASDDTEANDDGETEGADSDISEEAANSDAEEAASAEEKPKEKKPFPIKAVGITCGCIVGALAAAYIGGAIYFSSHFMPNTTVNGDDVSLKTAAELSADIDNRLDAMKPHIEGLGISLDIPASEVNIQVDSSAFAKSALQQEDNLAWPVEVFSSHELTANYPITYSKGTLTKLVRSAVDDVNKNGKEPQNATIDFDKKEKKYVVVAGDPGTLIDEATVISAVDAQLQNLKDQVTLTEENLKKPAITADNKKLNAAVEEANAYFANPVVFKNGDKELFSLDGKTMKEWVTIDEDLDVTYDEEVARDWLNNKLRAKVDSAGSTRKYKREDGETIEVTGGTYGWAFTLDGVTDKVLKKIKAKKGGTIKLKTIKKGAVWNPGGKDWEGKYIDIDLGDQYARLYDDKGKVIWESDVVTGNTSAGHSTPTGVYVINDMARNVTLVSSKRDEKGKPTYESPVSYWMPFIDNSVGLHDASWRSSFGGGIYTYNGSHGCVNLPPSKAASLYELIEPGMVVSCHY